MVGSNFQYYTHDPSDASTIRGHIKKAIVHACSLRKADVQLTAMSREVFDAELGSDDEELADEVPTVSKVVWKLSIEEHEAITDAVATQRRL